MKDWLSLQESAWRTDVLFMLQRLGDAAVNALVGEINLPPERRDEARLRACRRRWDLILELELLLLGG